MESHKGLVFRMTYPLTTGYGALSSDGTSYFLFLTRLLNCKWKLESTRLTSQVLDEVLQLHLPLRLDVGAVHIRIEEDDGKGQDEDGVWVLELPNQHRVTHTVPLAEEMKRKKRKRRIALTPQLLVTS